MFSRHMIRHAVRSFLMSSAREEPETLTSHILILRLPRRSFIGKLSTVLMRCAETHGTGRRITHTATRAADYPPPEYLCSGGYLYIHPNNGYIFCTYYALFLKSSLVIIIVILCNRRNTMKKIIKAVSV